MSPINREVCPPDALPRPILTSLNRYRISMLFLVPPIIIQLVTSEAKCKKYDLSCVRRIFTGAAPLGAETAESLQKQYPEWKICQAYGLTETCAVVSSSNEKDIWFGSSGSVCYLPISCRISDSRIAPPWNAMQADINRRH